MTNEQFIYASEYIFPAAEIRRLLDSIDPSAIDSTDVSIQVLIEKAEGNKVFQIRVQAILEDKSGEVKLMTDPATGCPRPPSC